MYRIKFSNANLGTLHLQHLPLNINDIKSHFLRSERFYGVLRQIEDVSFIWIKEAADYIRNVVNAYGVQSIIEVSMQYTDNNIDYEQFYTGILDLKAFTDNTVEIECRVISSSAESKYLNNIETQYRLYLPSILNVRPKVDQYGATFNCITSEPLTKLQQVNHINTLSVYHKKVTTIDAEITGDADRERYNNNVIRDGFELSFPSAVNPDLALSGIYTCGNQIGLITINTPVVRFLIYRFEDLGGVETTKAKLRITALRFNPSGTYILDYKLRETDWFSQGGSVGASSPYAGLLAWNYLSDLVGSAKGEKIVLAIDCISNGNPNIAVDFKFVDEFQITTNSQEYKTDTQHRCLAAKRAFERLIDSTQTNQSSTIDPTTTYVESELLTSERYFPTVVTSGLELRKAPTSNIDGEMVTSIADLWESLNTPFCLGMGLRKQGDSIRVKIDHRSDFFKPTIVYDLGEVTEFKSEFDETYVRNVLNIVYPGVDNSDFPNGIYEYLTKYGYTLPSNYVDNSLEISCPYKVDATSVEKVRTNSTSETQDSVQDDESNFLIRCYIDGSTYYNSRGEEFDSISQTGLQNNTQLFNVDMFAPIVMRFWAWWILGGLKYYPPTDELVIQRNYPNADVAITVDGIVCDTNNISIAKLKQLAAIQDYTSAKGDLFEPFAYTFKAPVSVNFINIFNNERHGVLKFSYKNKDYYGFGMKVPALPKKSGEFRLLKLSKRGESLCV